MDVSTHQRHITIPVPGGRMEGELIIPSGATALVLFSHGSGSSRFSPRNNYVASLLHRRGIATFLFDLLTPAEEEVYETRFDISLLTTRLVQATRALTDLPEVAGMELGYFGASTGAASALGAAVILRGQIAAVVSRGGRPDLVPDILPQVEAPTLFVVGEQDEEVLALNRQALALLRGEKKLEVVKGATHLFEEEGTLRQAAELAADWYCRHFTAYKKTAL